MRKYHEHSYLVSLFFFCKTIPTLHNFPKIFFYLCTVVAGGSSSKEDKSKLARTANMIRKTLLSEIRTGLLSGMKLDASLVGHAVSEQFKELVSVTFSAMVANHNS